MEVEPTIIDSGILRSSPALHELFDALSAAQGELHDPGKTKTAKVKMKAGGEYGYKYSDLADLLKIVRPVFSKHGLCLIQFPVNPRRGAVTIVTRIGHKSGQWIEGELTMPVEDDRPQTLGSMITYGRRYAGGAAAGMSSDEDDDGQIGQDSADGKKKEAQKKDSGYDPSNRAHQDALIKRLQKRKIPDDRWDAISSAMKGRPSEDFDRVIEEVLL